MEPDIVVGFVTTSPETSRQIASTLVESGLAACVNIISGVESLYKWDGETKIDGEHLLLVKATKDRVDAINQKLHEIHPYDVFEFVTMDVTGGNQAYLDWVAGEVLVDS
jgi:periplasmic divalent cation tolerance protein